MNGDGSVVKGVETTDSSHFITPRNIERLKQAKEANKVQVYYPISLLLYFFCKIACYAFVLVIDRSPLFLIVLVFI